MRAYIQSKMMLVATVLSSFMIILEFKTGNQEAMLGWVVATLYAFNACCAWVALAQKGGNR